MQGFRCHFITMPGKSPIKLEVMSRHDHSCLRGRNASNQTNKQIMAVQMILFIDFLILFKTWNVGTR